MTKVLVSYKARPNVIKKDPYYDLIVLQLAFLFWTNALINFHRTWIGGTLSKCQNRCVEGFVYFISLQRRRAMKYVESNAYSLQNCYIVIFLNNELSGPIYDCRADLTNRYTMTLWPNMSVQTDLPCSLLMGSIATVMRPGWTT